MEKTYLFSSFPDYNSPGFSMENFENLFDEGTVVFNASTSNAFYAEHGGSFTLKCVFKGTENYTTRKCGYKVDESSFLVIKEDHLYSSYIDSIHDVESFSIFFNKKLVNDTIQSMISPASSLDSPELIKRYDFPADVEMHHYDINMVTALMNLRKTMSSSIFTKEAVREKLNGILELILLRNEKTNRFIAGLPAVNNSTRREYYKRLKYVTDFMQSNYSLAVTLKELSNIACMNQSHLIRIFKKIFGLTPYTYLTTIRLEKAKQLLLRTNYTISEISLLVGFEKLSSFSYLFATRYNISPSAFRKLEKVNIEETFLGENG